MQDQQQTGNLFQSLCLSVLSTLAHWTRDDFHNEKDPMSKLFFQVIVIEITLFYALAVYPGLSSRWSIKSSLSGLHSSKEEVTFRRRSPFFDSLVPLLHLFWETSQCEFDCLLTATVRCNFPEIDENRDKVEIVFVCCSNWKLIRIKQIKILDMRFNSQGLVNM